MIAKVLNCIICDDFREEVRGKAAILGFLGICPDVEIKLDSLGGRLPQICFVFVVGPATVRETTIRVWVIKPSGKAMIDGVQMPFILNRIGKTHVAIAMQGPSFDEAGLYTSAIQLGDTDRAEFTFGIQEGPVILDDGKNTAKTP